MKFNDLDKTKPFRHIGWRKDYHAIEIKGGYLIYSDHQAPYTVVELPNEEVDEWEYFKQQ